MKDRRRMIPPLDPATGLHRWSDREVMFYLGTLCTSIVSAGTPMQDVKAGIQRLLNEFDGQMKVLQLMQAGATVHEAMLALTPTEAHDGTDPARPGRR